MPIAITVACVLAMVLYLLCNVAYLTILPLDVMKTSSVVAKVYNWELRSETFIGMQMRTQNI